MSPATGVFLPPSTCEPKKADILQFIFNTVASVMNAYNNITWESDRLEYEEGTSPYGNTLLAILGIPTQPRKGE